MHLFYTSLTDMQKVFSMKIELEVNGIQKSVDIQADTKLLWVLRDELKLHGTKYGCGIAACGACMILVDGVSTFACQMPAAQLVGKSITTIEGLSEDDSHPLQQAWIEEQVPQCGYCQSGQIMRASELLSRNSKPTREEIVEHMNTNLCRCGTYPRIIKAIDRAAKIMRDQND
jgi:isoquinoline 1-oxidoreductase subunit alpha